MRKGDTILFEAPPSAVAYAAVGGKKEAEGPLADAFDMLIADTLCGEKTWEKAESDFARYCLEAALKKGRLQADALDAVFAGDLQCQCTASAYTMRGMLKRVVNAGTAGRIRALGLKADMGGKTGTSQKNSDAWFVGVTPKLVAGAWVGGEDRSIHLSSGGEGSRIALPIFANFMKKVYCDSKLGITEKDQFPIPVNAVSYDCDESAEPAAALPSSGGGDEFFD